MLLLGLVLLVLGGLVAYFGRPREQLLFWAGCIIFAAGIVVLIIWLVGELEEEGVKTGMRLLGA